MSTRKCKTKGCNRNALPDEEFCCWRCAAACEIGIAPRHSILCDLRHKGLRNSSSREETTGREEMTSKGTFVIKIK